MRHRGGVGRINRGQQASHAATKQRGNIVKFGETHQKGQFAGYGGLDYVALMIVQAVPLVNRHHQRTTRLQDESGDVRVLIRYFAARIQHKYYDVRVLYRLQRFNYRKLLHRFENLPAPAQASCINQGITAAVTFEIDINAAASSPRLIKG